MTDAADRTISGVSLAREIRELLFLEEKWVTMGESAWREQAEVEKQADDLAARIAEALRE